MRGRLVLAGTTWEALHLRELLDVGEALLLEGSDFQGREEITDRMQSWGQDFLVKVNPAKARRSWGISADAAASADAMKQLAKEW